MTTTTTKFSDIGIHQHHSGKRYVVNEYRTGPDGQRQRKKHQFVTREDAQRYIDDAGAAISRVGDSKAFLNPDQLEQFHTALAILPAGLSLVDAVKGYIEMGGKQVVAGITYGQAMEEYWELYLKLEKAQSTYDSHEPGKARFIAEFGHLDAATNIGKDLRDHHLALLKQGLAWHTVKRQRILISQFLDWAVEERYCNENFLNRKGNAFPAEPKLKKRWLTVDQAKALLNYACNEDPALVPVLALGMFAGIRPEETQVFQLDQLDWELKEIHVRIAKHSAGDQNTRRVVRDLPETFWTWMEWWQDEYGGELNFTNFAKRFRAAIKASGYTGRTNSILRKSYGTYATPYLTQDDVRKQVGHSTAATTAKHYEGDATKAQAREYFAILPSS